MSAYKRPLTIAYLILLLHLPVSLEATIHYVGTGQTHTTITSALSTASPGDTIHIMEDLTEAGITITKNITIQGDYHINDGTCTGPQTIIQAAATIEAATDRVFTIPANINVNLRDLCIQNGYGNNGGGIHNAGDLYMRRVTVRHCQAWSGDQIQQASNGNTGTSGPNGSDGANGEWGQNGEMNSAFGRDGGDGGNGQNGTDAPASGSQGGNGGIGTAGTHGGGIYNTGNLVLEQCTIGDSDGYGNKAGQGGTGGNGGMGGTGGTGGIGGMGGGGGDGADTWLTDERPGHGGDGGHGGLGGNGSPGGIGGTGGQGGPGGEGGGIYNTGYLKLINTTISGNQAGDGGPGGTGGSGGTGGEGGRNGSGGPGGDGGGAIPNLYEQLYDGPPCGDAGAGGNAYIDHTDYWSGDGGNGGHGGTGGGGGQGGNVGGIYNRGTLILEHSTIAYNGSGNGGLGGQAGAAGTPGIGGAEGGGGPAGQYGICEFSYGATASDGNDSSMGNPGQPGQTGTPGSPGQPGQTIGIYLSDNAQLQTKNTIIANHQTNNGIDLHLQSGQIITYGYNLVQTTTAADGQTIDQLFSHPTDITGDTSTDLYPLQLNCGTTKTCRFESNSPARNNGHPFNISGDLIWKDQQNANRMEMDIGAWEYEATFNQREYYFSTTHHIDRPQTPGHRAPVLRIDIYIHDGDGTVTLDTVIANIAGTQNQYIDRVTLYASGTDTTFHPNTAQFLGQNTQITNQNLTLPANHQLQPGKNTLWIVYTIPYQAEEGPTIDAACQSLTITQHNGTVTPIPEPTNPNGTNTIKDLDPNPGYALQLNGTTSRAWVPAQYIGNPNGPFTLETWIKLTGNDTGIKPILAKHATQSTGGFSGYAIQYNFDQNHLQAIIGQTNQNITITGPAFNIDEWNHVALTSDDDMVTLYANGNPVGTIQANDGIIPNNQPLGLGWNAYDNTTLNAQLEETRYWDTNRSEYEIKRYLHRIATSQTEDLVSCWQYNQNTTTIFDQLNLSDAILQNTQQIPSNAPVARGTSVSRLESDPSPVEFYTTGVTGTINVHNNAIAVMTRLDWTPNQTPDQPDTNFDNPYWILHRYGTGSFDYNLQFTLDQNLTQLDQNQPTRIRLYQRPPNSHQTWNQIATAAHVDASANTVTFNNITTTGQYLVARHGRTPDENPGLTLTFDGSDDYATIPNNTQLQNQSFTIEFWIKPQSLQVQILAEKTDTQPRWRLFMNDTEGHIEFDAQPNELGNLVTTTTAISGHWMHIAATYDHTTQTARLYANGKLESETNNITDMGGATTGGHIQLARANYGDHYNGSIDELAIWNRPLSEMEIRENMHLSHSGIDPGLVGYWQFNQDTTTLYDHINTNDGTIHNDPIYQTSTVPVATGQSNSQTEQDGAITYTPTGARITYQYHDTNPTTITRLDASPASLPDPNIFPNQYWLYHRYGSGPLRADLHLTPGQNFTAEDAANPQTISLYARPFGSDQAWTNLTSASAIDLNTNTVTFNNLTANLLDHNQLLLTRDTGDIVTQCGDIAYDTTWQADIIRVTCPITINNGMTLTIQPGVRIEFTGNYDINVQGRLIARGLSDQPITFTVEDTTGYADATTQQGGWGGIRFDHTPAENDTSFLQYCNFDHAKRVQRTGSLANDGGVIFLNEFTKLQIDQCQFQHNTATYWGGAIFVYDYSDLQIRNSLFRDNRVCGSEGNGGAIKVQGASLTLTNATLIDNHSTGHGGALDISANDDDTIRITNSIIWHNHADMQANNAQIYLHEYTPDESVIITYSNIQGGWDGVGNINEQPQFYGVGSHPYQIQSESPGIDQGHPDMTIAESGSHDLRGAERIRDDDNDGAAIINMGAYEQILETPRISQLTPADNSLIHDLDTNLMIEFSENIVPAYGLISIYDEFGLFEAMYADDASRVSVSGNQVSIDPTYDFGSEEVFYVKIADNAFYDIDGNAFAGIADNTTWNFETFTLQIEPSPGHALAITAEGGYARVPAIDYPEGSFTVEAWARLSGTPAGNASIIAQHDNQNSPGGFCLEYVPYDSDGPHVRAVMGTQNGWVNVRDYAQWELNAWHHVALVYDQIATQMHFYVDGAFIGSETAISTPGDVDLGIGYSAYFGNEFSGHIDQVRLWKVARTQQQIRETMHLTNLDSQNDLVSYWQFNEAQGSMSYDRLGTNDALITNPDWVVSTVAVGSGDSFSATEADGPLTFTNTGLEINFNQHNNNPLTVTRIDRAPNILPADFDDPFDSQYWVIHRYGDGPLNADLSFSTADDMTPEYGAEPFTVKLATRAPNADGAWSTVTSATSVDATQDQATFSGLLSFDQMVIGWDDPAPQVIALDPRNNSDHYGTQSILHMTFDKAVLAHGGLITIRNVDNTVFAQFSANNNNRVLIDGAEVIIDPGLLFADNATYSVLIENSAFSDGVGHFFSGFDQNEDWRFSVVDVLDDYPGQAMHLFYENMEGYMGQAGVLDFPDPEGSFTVECWVRLTDYLAGIGPIITKHRMKDGQPTGFAIEYAYDEGLIRGVIGSGGAWHHVTGSSWELDTWHHVALVFDDGVGELRLFVDGWLEDTASCGAPDAQEGWLYFGDAPYFYGQDFLGMIDEARFWDRARTQAEIREWMHLTLHGDLSGLRACWQFNEGSGDTIHDPIGGYDLTIDTTPGWVASTVATGGGYSYGIVESDGSVAAPSTGVHFDFAQHANAEVMVTRIDRSPNLIPNADLVYDDQYWVINRFGSGNLAVDLTFELQEDVVGPTALLKLFNRPSRADTGWTFVSQASEVDETNDRTTFANVQGFSQMVVVRDNTSPVLHVNAGLTLDECSSAVILSSHLAVTDQEQSPADLVLTIETAPVRGQLELSSQPGQPVTTFTQAQVDEDMLTYVHDCSETQNDTLTFTVTDGAGGTVPTTIFAITVNPVNDPPLIQTNTGLTLNEATTATITPSSLSATDADDPNAELQYRLIQSPAQGNLERLTTARSTVEHAGLEPVAAQKRPALAPNEARNREKSYQPISGKESEAIRAKPRLSPQTPLKDDGRGKSQRDAIPILPDDTFTQADIDNGRITYSHDGSETTSDQITLQVQDPHSATTEAFVFTITIIPVNDLPYVEQNTGITLQEGGTVLITTAHLSATDPEDDDPTLTFSLTQLPGNGQLLLAGAPLQDPAPTITQADIQNNQLTYQHNGSETTTDSFDHLVSDSQHATSQTLTFHITITPVNDPPWIVTNTGATLAEGTSHTITADQLSAADIEDGPNALTYTLQQLPSNGSLHRASVPLNNPGDTFTQGDINAGLVTYQHNGSETTSDTYIVDVHDSGQATTGPVTIDLTITPVNDAPLQIVPATQSAESENPLVFTQATGNPIYINDPDAQTDNLQVTLSVDLGILTLSQTAGLTFTQGDGFGDGLMQFSGDLLSINTSLNGLIYLSPPGSAGTATLTINTNDLGHNGTGGARDDTDQTLITINSSNDPPAIFCFPIAHTWEETPCLFSFNTGNPILISDGDALGQQLFVQLTVTNAVIHLGSLNGLNYYYGNGTPTVTARASLIALNQALEGLQVTPDPNYTTPLTLHIFVDDLGHSGAGGPLTAEADVQINIQPLNDAPETTVPSTTQYIAEGGTVTFTPAQNTAITVEDIDAGLNNIQITLTCPVGQFEVINNLTNITISGNQTSTVTLTGPLFEINQALDGLNFMAQPQFNGIATIQVSTNDLGSTGSGGHLHDNDAITVHVQSINDPPTQTTNTGLTVDEGNSGTIDDTVLLADDPDHSHAQLTYTVTTAPVNGTLSSTYFTQADLNSGGLSYQHDGSETTGDSFVFQVCDALNECITGTFTITVDLVNDPPVAVDDSYSTTEDTQLTIADPGVLANDTDVDGGALSAMLDSGPTNADSFTLNADGSFSYTPASNWSGTDNFTYHANDTADDSNIATVTITVAGENDGPAITVPGAQTVAEDTDLDITGISVSDTDADPADIQLSASVANGTLTLLSHAGLTMVDPDGDASFVVQGTVAEMNAALAAGLRYHGDPDYNGPDQVDLEVDDLGQSTRNRATITASIAITVNPVNDPPTLTVPGPFVVEAGQMIGVPGIVVSDMDAGGSNLQVDLAVTSGLLSTDGNTWAASLSLTDTELNLNNELSNLQYQTVDCNPATDQITVDVDDLGNTGSGGNGTASGSIDGTISDTTPPTLVCQAVTVDLVDGNPAIVTGDDIFDATNSTDNCGIDLYSLEIFRLTQGACSNNSGGTLLEFGCVDVGLTVDVELVGQDNAGNPDTCQTTVTVTTSDPSLCEPCTGSGTTVTLNLPGRRAVAISPPVNLASPTVGDVFASLPANKLVYTRNCNGTYRYLTDADELESGVGYFVRTGLYTTVDVDFIGCELISPVQIERCGTWNGFMTGNPFLYPLEVSNFVVSPPVPIYMQVFVNGYWRTGINPVPAGAAVQIYTSATCLTINPDPAAVLLSYASDATPDQPGEDPSSDTIAQTSSRDWEYRLEQSTPNPFTHTATIRYQLPVGQRVKLDVFNVAGQLIRTLVDTDVSAGDHEITWDGTNANGESVNSGVYFYRLTTNDFSETKRMVLMR